MPPKLIAEVVRKLISLVDARLRAVVSESQGEEPCNRDNRQSRSGRVLRVDVEADRRWENRIGRLDSNEVEPRVANAQLIQYVRIEDVVPRRGELFAVSLGELPEPRQS